MKVVKTSLPGCVIVEPAVHGDARGFFYEGWNQARFRDHGLDLEFVQSNVSASARGVLRGLHYQWPGPQGKYVSVLEGEVYDVAVDIRSDSPTFGQWEACVLSAANHRHFWVPPGFAHGFLAVSEVAEFLYKTTDYWYPEHERTLLWSDPALGLEWPLAEAPTLAARDAAGTPLAAAAVYA